jgi:hypothetical protein
MEKAREYAHRAADLRACPEPVGHHSLHAERVDLWATGWAVTPADRLLLLKQLRFRPDVRGWEMAAGAR